MISKNKLSKRIQKIKALYMPRILIHYDRNKLYHIKEEDEKEKVGFLNVLGLISGIFIGSVIAYFFRDINKPQIN